jgi:dTDP-4-dehydrorhamnose 3,5-epimerase
MKIIHTKIKDVLIIEPDIFEDDRGWFTETYHKEKFKDLGINIDFIQHNHSFTKKGGTLRGLHFQKNPYSQSKIVRCTRGAVLDVAVDLRKDSPTYKEWIAVELTEDNKKKLFVPKGFAHGFLTLTDNTEFQYKVDNYYNKEAERSIHFKDPTIGIVWGYENPILSEKDEQAPFLEDCDINF